MLLSACGCVWEGTWVGGGCLCVCVLCGRKKELFVCVGDPGEIREGGWKGGREKGCWLCYGWRRGGFGEGGGGKGSGN